MQATQEACYVGFRHVREPEVSEAGVEPAGYCSQIVGIGFAELYFAVGQVLFSGDSEHLVRRVGGDYISSDLGDHGRPEAGAAGYFQRMASAESLPNHRGHSLLLSQADWLVPVVFLFILRGA